jgi:hypothetical protein
MAEEMTEGEESGALGHRSEAEIRELMGMFDVPSFARRGHALEFTLARFHDRCHATRSEMLDMVRMRLKQWTQASNGPDAWRDIFAGPISDLWPLSQANPPIWSESCHPIRRRQAIANNLIASTSRFNARWLRYLDGLDLKSINAMIHQYNQFYILEKECVLGSARLAARFFQAEPLLSTECLLQIHPILPVPEPA